MSNTIVKAQLADLAEALDAPNGPGSGAICLDALAEIEALERRLRPPADPSSP